MDDRFLDYYDKELSFLRHSAQEFAREFPKNASMLGLDAFECADPYVERLLEGFAYLAARVHLKLDADFPRVAQALLESIYPHYLAPVPAMAIVQIEPDPEGDLVAGPAVPRGSVMRNGPCEFRTVHDTRLWPLEIEAVEYHASDVGALELPDALRARSALRIRLRTIGEVPFHELELDRLTFHLPSADGEMAMSLYEELFTNAQGVFVQRVRRPFRKEDAVHAGPEAIRAVGFEPEESLFPYDPRSFDGYRLLHEYSAFPERFMFFEVTNLAAMIAGSEETVLDIIIPFSTEVPTLERRVTKETLLLGCTPIINLFPKRSDRIHVEKRFADYHVFIDRNRPYHHEVFTIQRVLGYDDRNTEWQFDPFYTARDEAYSGGTLAYYNVFRRTRNLTDREVREGGARSSYRGSDVFLSVVDAQAAPFPMDMRDLAVEALVTNRDLPLDLQVGAGRTDFTLDDAGEWRSVRTVGRVTSPRASLAERTLDWRLISHLSLNHLSLHDPDPENALGALRDILQLYGDSHSTVFARQVEGISGLQCKAVSRRAPGPGPMTFLRGLELELTFQEQSFRGTGIFLFGAVLERFFRKYVSINSFTETVIMSNTRGEVKRWQMRTGARQLL